jgi:very-short-patch-repair endonuclease
MAQDDRTHQERSIKSRQIFFDTTVYHPKVRETISGTNEDYCIKILNGLEYFETADFERQYPVGGRFVLDFAFVKEQIALEIDGIHHDKRVQIKKDRQRDSYLRRNNWIPIRIKDKDFKNTYRAAFYKNLIRDIVQERREQYENGVLYPIDFDTFYEQDYE